MKFSENWLRTFVDLKLTTAELADLLTFGGIEVDGMNWGNITEWKNKYDTAIENLLAGHESEHALIAL